MAEYADYNSSYVQPPRLTATLAGGNVVVSWTPAGGSLYSSPDMTPGSWTLVGTANPATLPAAGGKRFFQVKP